MKKVLLITGSNGFIGQELISLIREQYSNQYIIKSISRKHSALVDETLIYADFEAKRFAPKFFEDVEVIVHLASIAHKSADVKSEELKKVNELFFESIMLNFEQKNSLKKVIVISSYAVTLLEKGISLDTISYAISKQNLETMVKEFSKKYHSISFWVVRPPMVYGKNAPGNIAKLIKILKYPILLPLGNFYFKRSFIHVKNLSSFIVVLLNFSPVNGSENLTTIDIADPWNDSVIEFILRLKSTLKLPAILLPIPIIFVKFICIVIGKKNAFNKLTTEFAIDSKNLEKEYGWKPLVKKEQSFADLT